VRPGAIGPPQRARLRAARAATHRRLGELFEFAPAAWLSVDRNGPIGQANRAAHQLLAADPATLPGRPFTQLLAADHLHRWQAHLAQARNAEDPAVIDVTLRSGSGSSLDVQVRSVQWTAADGSAWLHQMLCDLTERKLAEADRRIAQQAVFDRESERRRIALALREQLGQRLSAVKMELGTSDASAELHLPASRAQALRTALDTMMAEVRRMASELRPLMLDDLGPGAAMDWLAKDSSRRLAIEVSLETPEPDPPLAEDAAVAIYRIVQAAIAHLQLGGGAGDIGITVHHEADRIVLNLLTDRTQTAVAAAESEASQSLRDWVHLMGGELRFEGDRHTCRRVSVVLPLPRMAGRARIDLGEPSARGGRAVPGAQPSMWARVYG